MGTGEKPVLATFATDWTVPKYLYRGGSDEVERELARFGLRHAGDWLRDGIFSFQMKAHPELVMEMSDLEQNLLAVLTGGWQAWNGYSPGRFLGHPLTTPLTPLETGEALSSQPLRQLDLRHIRKGKQEFNEAAALQKQAFGDWMGAYVRSLEFSPTQRPALEARAWAVTEMNSKVKVITPDQFRAVVGPRIFEVLRGSGRLQF